MNLIEEKAFSFCNNLQQVKYYGEYSPSYRWNVFEESGVEIITVPSNYQDTHFCDYPIETFNINSLTNNPTYEHTITPTIDDQTLSDTQFSIDEQTTTDANTPTKDQTITYYEQSQTIQYDPTKTQADEKEPTTIVIDISNTNNNNETTTHTQNLSEKGKKNNNSTKTVIIICVVIILVIINCTIIVIVFIYKHFKSHHLKESGLPNQEKETSSQKEIVDD